MHDDLQAWVMKYYRKARILKWVAIVQGVVLCVIAVLGVMYANNDDNRYARFLSRNDLREFMRLGQDGRAFSYGEAYTVRFIFSWFPESGGEFAELWRSSSGVWSRREMFISTTYSESGGIIVWNTFGLPSPNFYDWPQWISWSVYYHNSNANALIEIDHALLPPGVDVTLRQWGSHYILQFEKMLWSMALWDDLEQIIHSLVRDFIE